MSVGYILGQLGNKMGKDPSNPADRAVLLRFVNESARELYTRSDLAGSLMEQPFKINGDQTLSLPSYVGRIRGLRELASMQVWHVNQLRPRYNQFNWQDMWKNYRLKGKQALMQSVTNQSLGVLSVFEVENPAVIVTLTGPTSTSTNLTEIVTMDAVSKNTKNNFLDYTAVKKNTINTYDITLSDVDGKLLTIIPNNMRDAMYQIVDVSACPWLPQNTSVLDNYMEVLYKRTLPYLFNDGDEFPAFDYDDVVVNKSMQLWAEEQEKIPIAKAYDEKATRTAAQIHEDQNKGTEDLVALVANPHDTILKRIGTGIRRRYSLYAGRKY